MIKTLKKSVIKYLSKYKISILIFLIISIGFFLRINTVSMLPLEYHSWEQTENLSIVREYLKNGIDLFNSKSFNTAPLLSGLQNENRIHSGELPIYQALCAIIIKIFLISENDTHIVARSISVVSSCSIILFLYWLGKKEHSKNIGIISAIIFAIFPFFVFYSRLALPDMFAFSFTLYSVFFLSKYFDFKEKKRK